ncbi:hypothetical protein [Sporosarcina cyprini]|uniref:hypothetical protein n=1 Tax=Sporosarcina cyprini TaxID=2910523 RepID=UPI001EDCA727|nr:hypothetical protein [Sporosarcina cyprini]MCG3088372.1 hypothetical protein [Sporosarcina cyprini]
MSDDTAFEIIRAINKLTDELSSLNDNLHFTARQLDIKQRRNTEKILGVISDQLDSLLNE